MAKDLHLSEYGSGGDITILGNDLLLSDELLQSAYLALFGGNVEASTKGNELDSEERSDWWANSLLYPQAKQKQFNSTTENILSSIVLNSAGRLTIQRAVEKDLEFLRNKAEVTVNVSVETSDRVEIYIKLVRLSNKEVKEMQLVFDNLRNEVIINMEI